MNWTITIASKKWIFPSSVNAPCEDGWAGVTCSCPPHTTQWNITYLSLSNFHMQGIISPAISNLTSLQSLDLSSNLLTGSIPSEIGQLASLEDLYLDSNLLTGSIPSALGNSTSLISLILDTNQLTGSIPTEIGQLSSLRYLELYANHLTGSIPPEIGQLSSLQYMYLYNNLLTGNIPSTIGRLSLLQNMYLYANQLTGPIPAEIGELSSIRRLELYNNQLTSSFPPEIGQLSTLQYMYLNNNQLTGSLPPEIGLLLSLEDLVVNNNNLTGTIPAEMRQLQKLLELDLNFNHLTGTVPSTQSLPSSLLQLFLASNQFTGSIPPVINRFSFLTVLNLTLNHLTGTIPSELGLLPLNLLDLSANQLNGTIPSDIGQLSNLFQLYLYSNQLTGTIPAGIWQLPFLQYLDIRLNQLTGSIPSDLEQLSLLLGLYLSSNQFNGTIPAEISKLSSLEDWFVDYNLFTGTIPSEIGQLSSLFGLYLNSNYFTGSIPQSLGNIVNLNDVYLYDNAFTSSIPSNLGRLTGLQNLLLQSNLVSSTIPTSLSNLSSLVNIFLDDNLFTGRFPAGIGSIASITQISLSNNQMTGSIFPSVKAAKLSTFNFANNLFTGSITDNIFSSRLATVVASGNCLHGTIPDTVCSVASGLIIFDFGNSGGNADCPDNQRIQSSRPPFIYGTFSRLGLSGTIPSCLFASSSMTALRLSGNRLHGSIASSSSSSIQLVNLTLAYNDLTGSIPDWIQKHSFMELDLSNNRLDGTLSFDFMVSTYQTTLGLAVNRLSGELPTSIMEVSSNMSSLNVLAGNIFACNNDDLPPQDPSAASYSCGSYELYVSSFTWLGCVGIVSLVVIAMRLIISRYQVGRNLLILRHLTSWSMAVDHSMEWTNRMHQLPEIYSFIIIIRYIHRLVIGVGILLFCIALSTYISLHPISSIVTYDYGYVISAAYLHYLQPVIFVGLLLQLLLCVAIVSIRSFLAFLTNHIRTSSQERDRDLSTSTSKSASSHTYKLYAWRSYFILFALNLINLVVVMTVNIAYVDTLIKASNYTRIELVLIQVGVGLFKVVWNGFYVAWSCDWLATFSSRRRSMRSRYFMSIINYIVAPIVATIIFSESCFYFVFNPAEQVSSSFELEVTGGIDCRILLCPTTLPISINSSSSSSFHYSFACGAALIVAYTPVLVLSYLFYGLFEPMVRLSLAFDNMISRFVDRISNSAVMQVDESLAYSPVVRVKGRDVVVRLMVHSTVLFTFGLASPLLIIPIIFGISMDCITSRLLVGKTFYDNDAQLAAEGQRKDVKTDHDSENLNPITMASASASGEIKMAASGSKTAATNLSSSQHHEALNKLSIRSDLLTMEHLDMASSWQAIDACFHLMIVFVMLFWALLFFDMIADVYGVINGIITMTCFAVVPAALLIALDNSNLLIRMMSYLGLQSHLDDCLMMMCGLREFSGSRGINQHGTADHLGAGLASDVVSSVSHDFEMMTVYPLNRTNDNRFIDHNHLVVDAAANAAVVIED
jgi:Leucine-rich repeat (LRR) protein